LNQRDKQARDKVSKREVTREFSGLNSSATSIQFKFPVSTRLAVLCFLYEVQYISHGGSPVLPLLVTRVCL